MKATVILIAGAVVVFVGLYVAFPYTDMGKEHYAANRENAALYIQALLRNPAPDSQEEAQRLIEKYDLQGIYETDNVSGFLKQELSR